MRNPIPSEPPVKLGPGEGYYKPVFPENWQSPFTLRTVVLAICFFVTLTGLVQLDLQLIFGVGIGAIFGALAMFRSVP